MGQMADLPSKPRKLVHPAGRDAAVESAAGMLGGPPPVAFRHVSLRHTEGQSAANARSVQAAGRKAGASVPDTEHLTELPNLQMYQSAQVRPGLYPGLAAGLSPLGERGGRLGRTARQLYRALGREATFEEMAEALGPDWNAARVQEAREVTQEPPELPDEGKNR